MVEARTEAMGEFGEGAGADALVSKRISKDMQIGVFQLRSIVRTFCDFMRCSMKGYIQRDSLASACCLVNPRAFARNGHDFSILQCIDRGSQAAANFKWLKQNG